MRTIKKIILFYIERKVLKVKKLVILRGKPASGKSTVFRSLKKKRIMKDWIMIDHPLMKKKLGKQLAKEKFHNLIKESMETGKNIIGEETSRKTLNKLIGYYIRKHRYKVIVFQFEVNLKISKKRDVARVKRGCDIHSVVLGEKLKDLHKMHEDRFDKNAILVDTNKLGKKQVVEFILKKLKMG